MSRGAIVLMGVLVGCWLQGCGVSGSDASGALVAEIETVEERFGSRLRSTGEVDWTNKEVQAEVRSLLRAYAEYANAHHGDSLAAVYLMKRADLLQGRGDHEAAIAQWLDVVEGFPRDAVAAEAIFKMGFLRETALRDTAGALKAYAELTRLFPESPWTAQAAMSAQWLTFSEERLIEALSEGP